MNDPNKPPPKCHKCGFALVKIKAGYICLLCLKNALESEDLEPWEEDDD